MTAQTCPNCGLLNPATAETCDCGYDFRSGKIGPRRYGQRRSFWSLKIDGADEAKHAIRDSALGFYAIAAVQAMAAMLGASSLTDALIFAALAFWLHRTSNRIPAVLLLIYSLVAAGTVVWSWTAGAPGGRNLVLVFFIIWAALKAVIATSKLARSA